MLRIIFFLFILSSTYLGYGQALTSTLRGTVTDLDTGQPLPTASVQLLNTRYGTQTTPEGTFRFDQLPVGRYTLVVSFLGYQPFILPELLLESGKEQVLSVQLTPQSTQLPEATVSTTRPVAVNSVQAITTEQTLRYAATYLDPARVATSFPGVAAANDQANGLVIRGNSPNGMQWRLEGVEIVNPNHLSNAGTFSDRPTQTGGGVNILSTQLLGTSYFLSGAFPAEYGNALSGVLDMKLRPGNNEKTEFTAQAGLIGLDLAAEGPLSKNSKASYLINYRYSFTGLLGALGVTFGGEDIRFQDLSFNLHLPTAKAGTFTVFGLGGYSSNVFNAERDTSLWVNQKDSYDILYKNRMGAAGATHSVSLGRHASLRTVLVASGLRSRREGYLLAPSDLAQRNLVEEDEVEKSRLSLSSTLTQRLGEAHRLKAGVFLTYQKDRLLSGGLSRVEGTLTGVIVQPYASWQWQLAPRLSSDVGLHYLHYTFNNTQSVEPRASLRWQTTPRQAVSFSYGLHSQLQLPQVYLTHGYIVGTPHNRALAPTRAHHLVLGYQYTWPSGSSLKLEGYLQSYFKVPVAPMDGTFSVLNLIETSFYHNLTNVGTGRNYGLEFTYQKYLTDFYYLLVSGSLYDATYVGSDGQRRSTRFNGNHTLTFTGGKEFKTNRQGTWGLNGRLLWFGGFRDTPIDAAASQTEQRTIYRTEQAFTLKMKDYFRPDLRIYWKKNKSTYNRTLSLDLQNVSNTQNEAFSYYDTYQRRVVPTYQLGLIPVLSYRWEF
ncbi:carboxypeptidase-like regulatory domain-containing protein [Rhabdobacter roseus]|uniref:TonB-dependent receptor n=1 Tax=Rhabdobacter roseus TaxID=1655419 RepID=A0A840TJG1_9BACT|nr:TonB-dependent receptor [Rhabdobacter roseus]MBB5283574.1 hypothetical protein [Rhabdobacter roseus]